MHTSCFNPDMYLISRPSLSLPFNHASYLSHEMFDRNPVLISSPNCCCSSCCCYSAANILMCNKLSALNPRFLCKGLSQSTSIQWSLSKRITFYSISTRYGNTSGFSSLTDLDRDYCYEKLSSLNEKKKQRRKGFRTKSKKQFLSNVSNDNVNDVEVMLSLLTNEADLEYSSVRDSKKIDKKHSVCDNKEKKILSSGVLKEDLKCDKEQGKLLEKDTVKGTNQDCRKKSEKKLIEEFSQHQSNVSLNIQLHDIEVNRVTNQSGSRMKYKQLEEMSDKDNSAHKQYKDTEKQLKVTKPQKDDMSATSFLAESSMKKCQKISTEVSDKDKDINEDKHEKTDHLVKITHSSEKSQKISQISNTHVTNCDDTKVTVVENDHLSLEMKMVERTMKGGSSHSSFGYGPKGPSVEMWHVSDASNNISTSSEDGDSVKNNDGKSLWTLIGDVFRFRSCSEPGGGKCSTCLSLSSESWFSSHQPDSSNNEEPSGTTESPIPFKGKKVRDNFDEWEEAYGFEDKKRKEDEMFMREALLEAKKAAGVGEVPVGAVLVKGGRIIARGYNLVEELCDSTAHAEMICIREASKELKSWRLLDTTLYVTLEPCPMCAGAILQARIDTVVWGAPNKLLGADGSWIRLFPDENRGINTIPTDKPPAPVHPFHPNIAVRSGVLAEECAGIMKQFFRLRRNKKTQPESPIPPEPESLTPPEPESPIPTSSITVSHDDSDFLSKMQHAFKIIFCL